VNRPSTRPARRHRTPSADVEAALLGSAIDLLEAEGPDALTVRRIAAAAGVSPTGVYNHFDGKNGIVDAIFQRGFATLTEAMAVLAETHDPAEALLRGGHRYRALALEHPTTYSVMFLKSVPGYEPSDASHEAAIRSFDGLLACVTRGIDSGALRPGDPVEVATQWWSGMHGAIALELAGIGFVEDRDRLYEQLLATMLRGLAAATGGPAAD
jgi:AcrR family transcriptional regulator